MNSLPKTVTRQRRGCDLNPGPSAPESSTLTTRLPRVGHNKCYTLLFADRNVAALICLGQCMGYVCSVYTYVVEVYTGERESAATDADVSLMLVGRRGDTGHRQLLKSLGFAEKKFQPGQVC